MARSSPLQGDFSAGEISPLSYGKVQEEKYKKGLARSFNGIPRLEGGWVRRSGTRLVASSAIAFPSRLKEFKFTGTTGVMLQFIPGYINFFTRSGPVLSGSTPYFIGSPFLAADIPSMAFQQFKNDLYIVCANRPPMKLTFLALTSWTLTTVNFKDGPYSSLIYRSSGLVGPPMTIQDSGTYTGGTAFPAGGVAFKIADIAPVTLFASGGLVGVSHAGEFGYLKEGDTVWVRGTSLAAANGDWTVTNVSRYYFSLASSSYAGAVVNTPGGLVTDTSFVKNNILYSNGAYSISNFRFTISNSSLWFSGPVVQIGSVATRVYDFFVGVSIGGVSASTAVTGYRPPAYGVASNFQVNYPTAIAFHENRLFLGCNTQQLIFGSYVGQYENFAPSEFATGSTTDNTVITGATAVAIAFLSGQRDSVNWLVSDEKGLVVGTSGGPWIVKPSSLNDAITATNISVKKVNGFPTNTTPPAVIGKSVIHLDPTQRVVREVAYFYSVDGFRSVDISEFYSHLSSRGITTQLVYQVVPISCLWFARNDGALLGMVYDRTQDDLRIGWHQHQLGGTSDLGGSAPVVESLAVMSAPDGSCDDVWMVVKRYLNGATVRTVEYMSKIFESFNRIESANFLDCSIEIDNPVDVQNATKGVTTSFNAIAHGLVTGDRVRLRDIVGLCSVRGAASPLNDILFTVTVVNANNFTVPFDSSALTAFVVTDAISVGLPGRTQFRKMNTVIAVSPFFNGETLDVLGDGAYLGSYTVVAGSITLTIPAGQLQIGYGFSSELKQLRLDAGASDGTSVGKIRRINEVGFMVDRSSTFEYGSSFDNMYPVTFRQVADNLNLEAPVYSGISSENVLDSQYDLENQICIRQKDPLPLNILAIMPQQVTYDKG